MKDIVYFFRGNYAFMGLERYLGCFLLGCWFISGFLMEIGRNNVIICCWMFDME